MSESDGVIRTARRFYLRQRLFAVDRRLRDVWASKQQDQPATPLPDGFPHLSKLQTIGYSAREDLDGADVCELEAACFTRDEAKAILAAFAALT